MIHKPSIYFDTKDYELRTVINRFLGRDSRAPEENEFSFLQSALHPHGIKELTMSQEIRVAYAVVNLLDTLEAGQSQDRINALQSLHDEVLTSASSSFRYNTGRVLIQIMKNLIRAHGNEDEQLRLAHDFRRAASGRRRIVRRMLKRYSLLEMPEKWNQIAFDSHVHDANTKGRKSSTHLIMDAWIKGLRKLDVVYYNFIEPGAVAELLQAADIMDIRVRIGLEFQVWFRGRLVQFAWQPRGFNDWREMLAFMQEKPTQHLMRMGREASQYHHNYVMRLLEEYNSRLRHELSLEFEVSLTEITAQEVISYVGVGQTSRVHLAELIYRRIRNEFAMQITELKKRYVHGDEAERNAVKARVDKINDLTQDDIVSLWLGKEKNPHVALPGDPAQRGEAPEIMCLSPAGLTDWITSIRSPCYITLHLCSLTAEDVLELLYECKGMISHLELFNLKHYTDGRMKALQAVSELQSAINSGNTVVLKRLIRNMIKESGCLGKEEERCLVFREILRNLLTLQHYYAMHPLGTRIGSDSTSRSSKTHGMGFVFTETLPARARNILKKTGSRWKIVPIYQEIYARLLYYPKHYLFFGLTLTRLLRKIPGLCRFGMNKEELWEVNDKSVRYNEKADCIVALGGFQREQRDRRLDFILEKTEPQQAPSPGYAYLNTTFSNICKVAFGFLLTVFTFLYTQTWWVLAWFGPLVWFGITGVRNIIQAILGGGGLRRTPLLTWNDYLSWTRLSDSLLYTGISVPLLELGIRSLFLEQFLGLNSLSLPAVFFTVLSLVNGIYIAAHNSFRGLPREAIIGNIFRSLLSIPVAIVYNFIIMEIFIVVGCPMSYLTEGAAVLSKMASDTVAAVIEGFADKAEYLRMRHWDYTGKLSQLFTCFSQLEILIPEEDVAELLHRPKDFLKIVKMEAKDLEKLMIANALDLMYFWMYQPRARNTLARHLATMTQDERTILAHSQLVLTRVHEVSQLMVDGLVGPQFTRALAFYLARYEEYLRDMSKLTGIDLMPQERQT
ncbi:MAG: hypothetical protein LBD42_07055 [Desulfovibrio sp.]|jgi:hypothetical protein|nr:hypothetical protein [Desulfovibrio sp.]